MARSRRDARDRHGPPRGAGSIRPKQAGTVPAAGPAAEVAPGPGHDPGLSEQDVKALEDLLIEGDLDLAE
jgi:hypothetical protein